jgi:hypothetical protein
MISICKGTKIHSMASEKAVALQSNCSLKILTDVQIARQA